jgi:HNH endonuclease
LTTKNEFGNSKGYGDRYPRVGTSGYAIWQALENIGFTANSDTKIAAEKVKAMKLMCDKGKVNDANVRIECTSFKKYLENKAKELELLKKIPDNTLDIYNNYRDIQKTEDQPILPDEIQGTDNYYEGTKHTTSEELLLSDGEAWEPVAKENWNANFVGGNTDTRDLAFQAIRLRRGQAAFRNALISAYGPQCMVTGCRVLAVIEAAHIKPYRGSEDHHVQNGLLLRADIHTLFDLNLIGIRPKTLEVAVHQTLAGSTYQSLEGQRLKLSNGNMPAVAELTKRWEEFKAVGD